MPDRYDDAAVTNEAPPRKEYSKNPKNFPTRQTRRDATGSGRERYNGNPSDTKALDTEATWPRPARIRSTVVGRRFVRDPGKE